MTYRGQPPIVWQPCGVGRARNWWLGSTNPSNGNNERNVNTAGNLNNNNAIYTYGEVPRL